MRKFITNDRIDQLLKQGRVEEALQEPVKQRNSNCNGVAEFIISRAPGENPRAEDVAYAGLTLCDFLYDYIRIDPEVVKGIEFARAADVDSVLSFARFADSKADLTGASLDGLHSELQGYVAEQIEAHHLIAQGHDVLFPDTANNPGWDLMVDGHPFQVKCLADSGGVLEHLHRYPEIPIIVNAELADRVGEHANVYVDPALHHDVVLSATEETLDRGRDLADFEIPWISLGVSGTFNLYYMFVNDTDVKDMLTCTATDTGGRLLGGTGGKYAGSALGLLLFGPAGAIVIGALGAMGGSFAGRRAIAKGRQLFVAKEERAVREGVHRVAEAAAEAMPKKIKAWSHKSEMLADNLAGPKVNRAKVQAAMSRRIGEHIEHWTRKKAEFEALAHDGADDPQSLFNRVLTVVFRACLHRHHIHEPMQELAERMREYSDKCKSLRVAKS